MRFLILCCLVILVTLRTFSQTVEYPSFWHLETDSANFSQRDSSPNASVVHAGALWVLGGWTFEDSVWHSKSDVWRSFDGIGWELINNNPPYHPYCAFVSYDNYIWAFGDSTYRSQDGVGWEFVETSIPLGLSYRATLFNDEIWLSTGNEILRSQDGFNWTIVLENTPWEIRFWPAFVSFDNKLWFFGGGINYMTGEDYYFNDVWSSENGVEWSLVKEHAEWPGRYWFSYQVYDDKLWILGGWNYHEIENDFYGNQNDVWYSEDGNTWFSLLSTEVWQPRHATFSWVFNENLLISAGYGSLGLSTLYNDVWRLTNEWRIEPLNQVIVASDTSFIYGDSINLSITTSSGMDIHYSFKDSVENNFSLNTIEEVPGEYIVRIVQPGNSIFKKEKKVIKVSIHKRDLIVKVPDYFIKFGDDIPEMQFEFDGFVYDDDKASLEQLPTILVSASKFSPVGVFPIKIEGGISSKYNLVFVEGSLHIEPGDDVIFFPNPTHEHINVFFSQPLSKFDVIVLDSSGQTVLTQNFEDQKSSLVVHIGHLPAGYYVLLIKSETIRKIVRLSKL